MSIKKNLNLIKSSVNHFAIKAGVKRDWNRFALTVVLTVESHSRPMAPNKTFKENTFNFFFCFP